VSRRRAARVRKNSVKQMTLLVCAAVILAGCAYAPPPAELPSAQPPTQAGVAGSEAQDLSEARALEQAEAKCSSEGKHAVAHRLDNATVYDCVVAGDAGNNGQNPPQP
jgi:hypothetical protein